MNNFKDADSDDWAIYIAAKIIQKLLEIEKIKLRPNIANMRMLMLIILVFCCGVFFAFLLTLFTIFNSRMQELKIILPLGILKHSWSHGIHGQQSISLKG